MLLRLSSLLLLTVEAGGEAALSAADVDRAVRDRFLHRVADCSMGGSPHFGIRSLAQQARAEWLGEARGPPPRWAEDVARDGSFSIGDRVVRKDNGKADARPAEGAVPTFYLLPGEVATVVEVDRDGDIRIVDPRGEASSAFRRKKFFRLCSY